MASFRVRLAEAFCAHVAQVPECRQDSQEQLLAFASAWLSCRRAAAQIQVGEKGYRRLALVLQCGGGT